MPYLPRIADEELQRRLAASGAVVIEGPKACGKTETALQRAASHVFLDIDVAAQRAMAVDPNLVLEGDTPRLIDEWQVAPDVWNHVRRSIDSRRKSGQFILTGSAVPADDVNRHAGGGRFSTLRMRPMTLFEAGHSTGAISLAELMDGTSPRTPAPPLTISDLADIVTVGGWPAQQGKSVPEAARAGRDYLDQMRLVDVGRLTGTPRDPVRMGKLLQSIARNTATDAADTVLADDAGISRKTVAEYLGALQRLMILEQQPAWSVHLRAKATLRSSERHHFVDPSLAVAALGAGPERLLKDLNFMGLLFESLVIRDLRVYAQPLDGQIYHYRDSSGLEVDAIVQLADGRWAGFEIKLGEGLVEDGARCLLRFAKVVDTRRCGAPALLAVISGNGFGYMRPDGIGVLPIGALRP